MKRLVSAFLPIFFAFYSMGQNGNEWIDYDQPYAKIPVGQDGLYRISHSALQQAGFPVSGDPRTLRLFHRGVEQAILVSGEGDAVFNPGDYIEFYGRKNDGALDVTLYESASHQPHRYYNLYSDTTAYFLTYGTSNGRRISTYTGSSEGLVEENYHRAEKLLVLRENYSAGIDYGNVHKTTFDAGEGWTGAQISQGQETVYTFDDITLTSPAHGKPIVEVLLTGRGPMAHNVELYSGSRLAATIVFSGYDSYKHTQEVEWSDVDGTGKLSIKLRVPGNAGPDRASAGYIRLLFPQQVSMGGVSKKTFLLNPNATNTCFLKIQNPPAGVRIFDITEPSQVVNIAGVLNTSMNVVVPSASEQRKILATNEVLTPSGIKQVSFRDINPNLHDYIIITHPALRKPALGYLDPVKAYAEYRALPEGGGFDTLVVNIGQLYDQFNYGEVSPRAIIQFMRFCAAVKMPQYLFLVGKGLDVNYGYYRNPSAFTSYRELVPTAGYPASDMAFTVGLAGTPHVPAVATGRLSVNTAADVAAYLNKVKERDALAFDQLNRKKILHLSGGIEESEPAMFRDILRQYEQVAEGVYLGGHVQAIAKQSTEVKLINIAEEVNAGLGLITFFGHSAPHTLDFDIGFVTDPIMGYNNPGKYPFLLMNGCDAGSFFLNATIMGENWIKTPNRGAVGFIAHSSYGLLGGLQRYSSTFYDVALGDSVYIHKGIGKVQQEVAKRYVDQFGASEISLSQTQQMVLLGDPAVRIFAADKPDYSPNAEKVFVSSFGDEPLTALSDSFAVNIPIRNFGLAQKRNMRVHIRREFGVGQLIEYDTIIAAVLYADTLAMVIRNTDSNGYGINRFTIDVDADDLFEELNEDNNTAVFEHFIPLNTTRNLFPYNFSIVNDRETGLSFQYTDLLGGTREYILEIDTIDSFNSAFKQQFMITTQVLGRQPVTLLQRDSTVYYWRTKIAQPLGHESREWTMSSFTYIQNGPEGWAQLHFPQYRNNPSHGLVKDPELRRIQFQETVSDLAIRTFSSSSGQPQDSVSFKINGVEFNLMYQGGACRNNTINLVAFDRRSTQPYAGIYFKWYEIMYEYGGRRLLCGREPYVINSFAPNELITGNQDDVVQYVDNIAAGDSVVLFNIGNAGYEDWPDAAISKLAELGIAPEQFNGVKNGEPLVILARKGSAPGTARIFHAASPADFVKVNKTIAGRFTAGSMSSAIIGPAQRWSRFIPRVKEVETVDSFGFALVGVKADGRADTLKKDIRAAEDLSFISATDYPQLKVVFESADDVNLTSVQLADWLVLFEPVAEGIGLYGGTTVQQTVFEGETVLRDFGFVNISNKFFHDSLTVKSTLLNASSEGYVSQMKIAPPAPGDTTLFTIPFNTMGKGGLNDVEIFINPRIAPEKTYDNNLIVLRGHLNVLTDQAGPVVDVTFDGRYLENGDYVSPDPKIVVRVWDENPFILKKDTLGMKIFLAYPCEGNGCEFEPIYFKRPDVTWMPASDTSEFEVHFSPAGLVDGFYTLRIEASDGRGNVSGETPYEIAFMVAREKSFVVSSAYPNPFIFEMNIDVTLTGDRHASYFYKLSLTTSSGTVVKEFDQPGRLQIGRNIVRWDGRGSDGDHLPAGIYFYRLLITGGAEDREYNGKIVLMK